MAGVSVPGNSCRSCVTPNNSGCTFLLSGKCVYYSGLNLPASGINTGDSFDTVVSKLNSLASFTSADDGLSITGSTIKLGQNVGASGNPAAITEDREVPLNSFALRLTGQGGVQISPLGSSTVDTGVMADAVGNLKSVMVENILGSIYNKSTWTDLSDFTISTATVAVVSGKLQFTGGANTFTQTAGLNSATSLEKWTMEAVVKVDTKNSTSFGFGFGIRSINSYGNFCHSMWRFDASTGVNSGKVIFNAMSGYTQYAISTSALSFSAGDLIHMTVRRYKALMIVSVFNQTTTSAEVTMTFPYNFNTAPYQANTGRFTIYSLGGQFTIQSLNVRSDETVSANALSVGDSKAAGSVTSGEEFRFVDRLQDYYGSSIVNAGEGDTTVEIVAALTGLLALKPKQVLMCIGCNDIRAGYPPSVYLTNYDNIAAAFAANGSTVFHLLPFPELTGLDQSPLTNHIIATYPANRIIDTSTPLLIQGGVIASDLIHPNDTGHLLIANAIASAGLLQGSYSGLGVDPFYIKSQSLFPQTASMWINSTIKTDSLAGTGNRVVLATSTGTLTPGSALTSLAANGLSYDGTRFVLGQLKGDVTNPAVFTSNRELPMAGFTLTLSSGGTNTTLDQLGFASSFRIISDNYLTIGANANFIIIQGKNVSVSVNDFPVIQLIGGVQNASLTYSGVVQGFNFSGNNQANEPLLLTTSPDLGGAGKAGDIIISPGRTQQSNFATQIATKYHVVLQPSANGGVGIYQTVPTAKLHIAAGSATAGTAPIKLTPGTLLTTPELGALEFTDNGTTGHLYITLNQAGVLTRVQIV